MIQLQESSARFRGCLSRGGQHGSQRGSHQSSSSPPWVLSRDLRPPTKQALHPPLRRAVEACDRSPLLGGRPGWPPLAAVARHDPPAHHWMRYEPTGHAGATAGPSPPPALRRLLPRVLRRRGGARAVISAGGAPPPSSARLTGRRRRLCVGVDTPPDAGREVASRARPPVTDSAAKAARRGVPARGGGGRSSHRQGAIVTDQRGRSERGPIAAARQVRAPIPAAAPLACRPQPLQRELGAAPGERRGCRYCRYR